MSVRPIIKRGSAELAILEVLQDRPSHGYEISKLIELQTQGALRFNLASLYPVLYTLEKRGWIRGSWQAAPSGRRRRYYRLTSVGKKSLAPLREEWGEFFRALHRLARVAHA